MSDPQLGPAGHAHGHAHAQQAAVSSLLAVAVAAVIGFTGNELVFGMMRL